MAANPFPMNTDRFDPYKNYRFVVKFQSQVVAGVSKVTGLKRSTDVIEYKEGGKAIAVKGMGRTKFEAITLERGITQNTDFADWANSTLRIDGGDGSPTLGDMRRDIIIELQSEEGQAVIQYAVYRCWVSEYQALPDLDAGGNAIAIEHIKIENEGWERLPLAEQPEKKQ